MTLSSLEDLENHESSVMPPVPTHEDSGEAFEA